jgi:hypothetical protein
VRTRFSSTHHPRPRPRRARSARAADVARARCISCTPSTRAETAYTPSRSVLLWSPCTPSLTHTPTENHRRRRDHKVRPPWYVPPLFLRIARVADAPAAHSPFLARRQVLPPPGHDQEAVRDPAHPAPEQAHVGVGYARSRAHVSRRAARVRTAAACRAVYVALRLRRGGRRRLCALYPSIGVFMPSAWSMSCRSCIRRG